MHVLLHFCAAISFSIWPGSGHGTFSGPYKQTADKIEENMDIVNKIESGEEHRKKRECAEKSMEKSRDGSVMDIASDREIVGSIDSVIDHLSDGLIDRDTNGLSLGSEDRERMGRTVPVSDSMPFESTDTDSAGHPLGSADRDRMGMSIPVNDTDNTGHPLGSTDKDRMGMSIPVNDTDNTGHPLGSADKDRMEMSIPVNDTTRTISSDDSLPFESAKENETARITSADDSLSFRSANMNDLVRNVLEYMDFNLLMVVQLIMPKSDSKDFVDRPTKRSIKKIRRDFRKLQRKLGMNRFVMRSNTFSSEKESDAFVSYAMDLQAYSADKDKVHMLEKFIDDNFDLPGSDLKEHTPSDYSEEPPFLKSIADENVRSVVLELNRLWKALSRVAVQRKGRDSTLLNLPHPFIIPGGRFREFYYWDTYFILEGLVVSSMDTTAVNIVKNFISIIDTLGYIPNGTRKYYMYRTQPPFFPMMLLKLLDLNHGKYNDLILKKGLDMALKEYKFFDTYRSVLVKGQDGKYHKLNYFHVTTDFPRPESLSEDIQTFLSQKNQLEREMYSNLKSGAESGWDFSSRWFMDETEISTIGAYYQVPVDLNATLFKNELIISTLLDRAGRTKEARLFGDRAMKRAHSINQVLWNNQLGVWNDYNMLTHSFVSSRFYFSNIFPLIMGIDPPTGNMYNVLQVYQKELFSYVGGVPASGPGKDTGQQWDFPNVWAPHQFLIVEYLYNKNERKMALQIARAFYNSVSVGYRQNGVFYEKYNAERLGYTGTGGEYEAQTGFGWTNGTALSFINTFKDEIAEAYDHQKEFKEIVQILLQKAEKEDLMISNDSDTSDVRSAGIGSAVGRDLHDVLPVIMTDSKPVIDSVHA